MKLRSLQQFLEGHLSLSSLNKTHLFPYVITLIDRLPKLKKRNAILCKFFVFLCIKITNKQNVKGYNIFILLKKSSAGNTAASMLGIDAGSNDIAGAISISKNFKRV